MEKIPKQLLMITGPVEIEQSMLDIGSWQMLFHRDAKFILRNREIFEGLQYCFETKNPVLMYPSSGSGAMTAAVCNTLNSGDKAVYCDFGYFGHRWGEILQTHGINGVCIKGDYGDSPSPAQVDEALSKHPDAKAIFLTHNETSTGALTDLKSICQMMKQKHPNVLTVSDSISALLFNDLKMDEWGVDIVVAASQKSFAIPPGLSFLGISQRVIEIAKTIKNKNYYFDINFTHEEWKKSQLMFTPPINIIYQLQARLEMIKKEGLESFKNRYTENTKYLRDGLMTRGFECFAKNPANAVTGIIFDDNKALEVIAKLETEHAILTATTPSDLRPKMVRIGNMGNITKKDIDYFLECFDKVVKSIRK